MHYQYERTSGCRISDAWTYRGLRTAILENNLIRVVVLIDKGADIYEFTHKPTDTEMLWRSPWGVRDPQKYLSTSGSPYRAGWTFMRAAGRPFFQPEAIPAPTQARSWACTPRSIPCPGTPSSPRILGSE